MAIETEQHAPRHLKEPTKKQPKRRVAVESELTGRHMAKTDEFPFGEAKPSVWQIMVNNGFLVIPIYLASRVLVLVGMLVAAIGYPNDKSLGDIATAWDGKRYLSIAEHGYPRDLLGLDPYGIAGQGAFFPGYPMLVRAADAIGLGGRVEVAVAISLLFGLLATWFVWKSANHFAGVEAASKASLLFAFFPGTLVFSWTYPEATAIAFTAGAVYFLLRGNLLVAGLFALVATASKPTAALLVIPFAIVLLQAIVRRQQRVRATLALVLASSGVGGYFVYLWQHTGEYNAWFRIEREVWGEQLAFGQKAVDIVVGVVTGERGDFASIATVGFALVAVALIIFTLITKLPLWAKLFVPVVMFSSMIATFAPLSLRAQAFAVPAFVALGVKLPKVVAWLTAVTFGVLLAVLTVAYGLQTLPPFFMWAL